MAPAAVAAATTVEAYTTCAMKTSAASPVKNTTAGLSSEGVSSRITAMIEPAEGPGMRSSRKVWRIAAVKAVMPTKAPAMRIRPGIEAVIEVPSS